MAPFLGLVVTVINVFVMLMLSSFLDGRERPWLISLLQSSTLVIGLCLVGIELLIGITLIVTKRAPRSGKALVWGASFTVLVPVGAFVIFLLLLTVFYGK